jgi:hypothetical protein
LKGGSHGNSKESCEESGTEKESGSQESREESSTEKESSGQESREEGGPEKESSGQGKKEVAGAPGFNFFQRDRKNQSSQSVKNILSNGRVIPNPVSQIEDGVLFFFSILFISVMP